MNNFKRIIIAESRDDITDLEFPCVLLVGDASEETRKEGIDIVMCGGNDFRGFLISLVPYVIFLLVFIIIIICQ